MNRSEGLLKGETLMKQNLKHSLTNLKNKLKLRKHMARVGRIKCYSTQEFKHYLNETLDGILNQQKKHACNTRRA